MRPEREEFKDLNSAEMWCYDQLSIVSVKEQSAEIIAKITASVMEKPSRQAGGRSHPRVPFLIKETHVDSQA